MEDKEPNQKIQELLVHQETGQKAPNLELHNWEHAERQTLVRTNENERTEVERGANNKNTA